ncbi:MAG: 4-(cytidine 5'-diphospho)-2-C-methyl-D-erythritol kinase [Alphaproteobacteria bacterium]|nr:4-(cytidine 5'-diphospho)-2-C-methyl-D-erythritol kinase [Alphaproteobacteria bacterium]MBV9374844.1 4-(cytidine 5'-diphospho)-2-C-methyl-D-erythritol kinase [Alphaproteobacteria bacterium]
MPVAVFAPAKINLYLHVTGRRADGYHLLDSLVAFAAIGDNLTVEPDASLSLTVGGPEAAPLAALGDDNLVLRAARLLAGQAGVGAGAAMFLEKNLPVAAGVGGGSSDAAAALLALRCLWTLSLDERALCSLGAKLGADVPACIYGRAVWVGGVGERVEPAGALPDAGVLLVNPRRALPTAAVFAARCERFGQAKRFAPMPRDAAGLAETLTSRRNELTDAAIHLVPEVDTVLAQLRALPGSLLARMSGSGATCFALFGDRAAAERARATLATAKPGWWCAAGGFFARPAEAGHR